MKKAVKFILPFFIIALITYSCSKENEIGEVQTIDYEKIGKEHNLGLEFIFNELKSKKISINPKGNNYENFIKETKKASISFIESSNITNHIDYENSSRIFASYDKLANKSINLKRKGVYSEIDPIDEMKNQVELTTLQVKFFDELNQAISGIDLTAGLEVTINKIKLIEEKIISDCNEDEKFILLSSTSIARNSLKYWSTNLEKWINELNENATSGKSANFKTFSKSSDWGWFTDTLKSMGKSDVVGGVMGAAIGSVAAGVGALPGAVAGACYSSAGRGIVALTEKWGLW
tara:strand:- start:199 stop:1071 length:873 start_codon:yes stop_codon:yes gene_type:complete